MSGEALRKVTFGVFNGYAPAQGPLAMPLTLDFSSVAQINFDLVNAEQDGKLDFVQAIWIDNADSGAQFTITFRPTGQRIIVAANNQRMVPVISSAPLRAECLSGGLAKVNIILLNVPMPIG